MGCGNRGYCAFSISFGSNTIRVIGLNFDVAGNHHQDTNNDPKSNILYLIVLGKRLTWLWPRIPHIRDALA